MPGLINRTTRSPLPLTASEVTSCVSGYAFGMAASLTYRNPETQAVEGLFVYPLDECTAVVGFEAAVSRRAVTVQIKDKAKMDETYFDSCSLPDGRARDGSGRIMMDEDLERIVFVANLGMIPPLESVSIFISTSSELQTLPSGAVRVLLPAVCVPKVPQPSLENASSLSSHQLQTDKRFCRSGSPEQGSRLCLAQLLENEATNPFEYEFSFHLEIRGPCLLAGVESPTHEIRADADPSARSAKSIVITLADKHTFDRPVEILIHPSEPHMPHVLMEEGDMTPAEYEQHLKGKNDFIKGTKKDPSAEKKTEIIRKRLNKDIPHHPVVMLNFCPDLRTVQPDLRQAQREFIFLVDRSRSMSGVNITRVKEALLVILKSLMPACLFNIVGFGSTFKTLFPASQTYCEESLAIACESIKSIRADMGGTNILSPLKWVIRQPIHRGHPRLLFLLTDGAISNTGKVLELLRNHSCSTRCYSFGIGPNACRRLVEGLAAVSRGIAEFLAEGERLQPKMIKSLKKAMAPVLSDVSVEWVFPESTEVLVSPISTSCLFPGDRLVGYGIVCDTSPYISNPRSDKRRRYSMMRSQESGSSVFFHSQEEGAGMESWNHSRDSESCCPAERGPDQLVVGRDPGGDSDTDTGMDVKVSSRRRAFSTPQIADHEPCKKVPMASDPSSTLVKNRLRKTHWQDLQQVSPEPWQVDFQSFAATSLISATRISGTGAPRPSLLPRSCVSFCHDADSSPVLDGLQQADPGRGIGTFNASTSLRSSSDSRSPGELDSAQHPSFTFETETSSDWEPQDWDLGSARGSPHSPRTLCKAVVKGLRSNEPVQWEVTFDIRPLFRERENQEDGDADLWTEAFHHLAAKSVIRDFEHLAEKECEIEHGSGRRYHVNAVHTSKACNVISKYTAFVPVDLSANTYLPTVVEYPNMGAASKQGSQRSQSSGTRRHRGFSQGCPQSACGQNGDDGFYGMNAEESSLTPSSTPSPHSGERCGLPEGLLQSLSAPSAQAQKSIENLFAARLTLNKTRLLTRAAKGFMSKSASRASEASSEGDNENTDYLPLVSLQLACGAFLLNSAFCDAVNIPMEKLKWTSPFACHRLALSPSSSYSSKKTSPTGEHKTLSSSRQLLVPNGHGKSPTTRDITLEGAEDTGRLRHFSGSAVESISKALKAEKELSPPAITIRRFSSPENTSSLAEWQGDSGRGSETDGSEVQALLFDIELQQQTEPEGMLWATAVALAWLEHSSASFFIEWELVAAKASLWLSHQDFPQGYSLATVKAAAQQLFVLLRHWDENLEFNLLCYNPSSV
ncbi:von Willebrand factor A domain-containing protein 5B1 [Patagioenas fasciata monilis]|uniref:von Willebrand factor A domain-containing protein 5B1 n=1 Tax=Patagioenas fasciata monilis TaxID=372326 RepID=A0A1V4KP87_PATFA|nr:von Willebrand factor A domain-containing protein 5B1 [Patagioenas fasciata monilis]